MLTRDGLKVIGLSATVLVSVKPSHTPGLDSLRELASALEVFSTTSGEAMAMARSSLLGSGVSFSVKCQEAAVQKGKASYLFEVASHPYNNSTSN